jgi:CRISPR-associated endonuclease Csy4
VFSHLELQSASTGGKYRLYIAFGKLQEQSVDGKFNRFGLSKIATVPIF